MNELNINEALRLGVEAHKAGNLQRAERCYRAILKSKPTHADANHNLGILAFKNNKTKEALLFFRMALNINSQVDQYWLSYIECLTRQSNFRFAKSVINEAAKNKIRNEKINQLSQKVNQKILESTKASNREIICWAINLRDTGKTSEAIKVLKDRLSNFPKEVELLALICHCYLINGEKKKANNFLKKAKAVDEENKLVQLNEARVFLAEGKVDEATLIAKKLNHKFPKFEDALGVLSSCFRAKGEIAKSLSYIEKAVEINENYAEGLITRGLIRFTQKDQQKASNDLIRGFYLKPHIKQIWDPIINIKLESKQYLETAEFILKIIEFNDADDEYYQKFIFSIQHITDPRHSIDFLNRSILIAPNKTILHMNLGLILSKQDNCVGALEAFQRATKINPDLEYAYYQIGFLFQRLKKFDAAIENYEKALKLNTTWAEAYYNLGITLHEIKKYDLAVENYEKALKLNPTRAEAYYNLGITLHEIKKYDLAAENYEKALKLNPTWAEAYYNLANSLREAGKTEDAIDRYQQAIDQKPNYTSAFLNLGVAFKEIGQLDAAIKSYKKVLELNPNHSDAETNLIQILTLHKPNAKLDHPIIKSNQSIREKFSELLYPGIITDEKVKSILTSCHYILEANNLDITTNISQIYRRSTISLNCKRHMSIFDNYGVIPEFCFGCFKVQVEPKSLLELVKLAIVFDQFSHGSDNTLKCMVEIRPKISGYYKGIIYCRGYDEASRVAKQLQKLLDNRIGPHLTSKIKRGCSEYEFVHPEFPCIEEDGSTKFNYKVNWQQIEEKYDQDNSETVPSETVPTKSGFSISDFLVIQTWMAYAVGIGDISVEGISKNTEKYPSMIRYGKDR